MGRIQRVHREYEHPGASKSSRGEKVTIRVHLRAGAWKGRFALEYIGLATNLVWVFL